MVCMKENKKVAQMADLSAVRLGALTDASTVDCWVKQLVI
jgi:hypothetical protein